MSIYNRSCIFWKVSPLTNSPLVSGLLKVAPCRPYCLQFISMVIEGDQTHPELGAIFSKNQMSGLLFADDFVELAETGSSLQILINIVHNYSKRWQFECNIKCATVVFSNKGGFHYPMQDPQQGRSVLG